MMKYFLIIIFTFQFGFLQSQERDPAAGKPRPKIGELLGTVLDSSSNSVIEFATVSIFKIQDSSIVAGAITDAEGKFRITEIPTGKYGVRVSFIGYKQKYISPVFFKPEAPTVDLRIVYLKTSDEALAEVEIVAEKADLETKIDRKVFNVEKNITSTGGSVNDVLNNIPSIEIDMDGNISLRGSGNVTVLIDGKASSLTGGGRTAILGSIPASSVESIEVITNPSAKYDPDGMSGIINIVLKKNKLKGVTTGIDLSAGTGNTYSASANLNYQNEKFNFFSNYSFRYDDGFRNSQQLRKTTSNDTISSIDQFSEGTDSEISQMLKLGMDIFINKKNTIGFSLTGNMGKEERTGFIKYDEYSNIDSLRNKWTRNTYDPEKNKSVDINFNFGHKFKNPKHQILLDLNTSFGNRFDEGIYRNQYYDFNLVPLPNPDKQYVQYADKNNFYSAALDYENPFNKKMKIESGFKGTIRDNVRGSYNEFYDYDSVAFVPQDSLNNIFNYTEQVYAAYGIFSHNVKEGRFSYQLGIRLEQAFTKAALEKTNEIYRNDYFSWFPSVHLSYKLGKKKTSELTLSYSKRINRPGQYSLNPFPNYSDPLNIRKGNPYLNPEYIHSVELGFANYSKYITVTSSVYFRYMTDMIQRILIVEDDGVNIRTWGNVDNGINYGVEAVVILKPIDWWKMNLSFNFYQVIFMDNSNTESDLNNSGFSWSLKFSSSMVFFKQTLEFQVNANYSAPRPVSQGTILARYNIDLALKKWFLNKTLAVGVRVSDILNSQQFQISYSEGTQENYTYYKWQSRRFYLNLTWRFGNLNQGKKKVGRPEGGSGGGDSEM